MEAEAEAGTEGDEVDRGDGHRPVPGWLAALVEQGLEAVVVFDGQLQIVYANGEALRVLGYPWSELAGLNALSLVHPDDLGRSVANVTGVAAGARPDPGLIRLRLGDGSWRPVEVNPRQLSLPEPPDGPGEVLAVSLRDHLLEDTHWRILADLAAGRDFEVALDAFAQGMSGANDGPMGVAFEVDGRRRTVGPLPAELAWPTGLTDRLVGELPPAGGDGLADDALAGYGLAGDPWSQALTTGEPCCTVVEDLPPDQRTLARALGVGVVVVVPVPDPAHGVPALLVQCPYEPAMGDIHRAALAARPRQAVAIGLERRHALAQLQHLAHHDPLTGLANRARFFDRLAERHRAGAPSGVCYLDLDRFKGVNDTHGHQVGDDVLLRVAAALLEVADGADVVARLGGDEFGVVCATGDVDVVVALASRVVDALESGVEIDGVHHDIGVSVGVAVGVDPPDELVAAADAALYEAKRDGRGTWRVAGPVVEPG